MCSQIGFQLSPGMAAARLKEVGARMTVQRKAVLDVLAGSRMHPTAESIISQVREKLGYVSPATIYNTLEALEELGLVRRIDGLDSCAHFDPDTSDHQHAICRRCRRVWDVGTVNAPADLPAGFAVDDIQIHGVCRDCAAEK